MGKSQTYFTGMVIKNKTVNAAYAIMASISLIMYIFGHSTDAGTLPFPDKLFYIPCAITLLIAFCCHDYWQFDKGDKIFMSFFILTLVSSIIIGNVIWLHIISCLLGFLIFRHIRNTDLRLLVNIIFILTPVVVVIHYVYTSPFSYYSGERYGGFQGDPNCFSLAMNILVYINGYVIIHAKKVWKRIVSMANIAAIIPLILAGASRSGVLCLVILIIISIIIATKRSLKKIAIIGLLVIVCGGAYLNTFEAQLENTISRFSGDNESDSQSTAYRFEEFSIAWNVITENPSYFFMGIGFSQTVNAHKYIMQYYHKGRAHNTYMSVLMEQGVFGFILFMWFLITIGEKIWYSRIYEDWLMRVALFGSLLAFIFTIFALPFLPFWFALYLCQNINTNNI